MSGETREYCADAADAGLRLDVFVTEKAPEFSRSRVQALIRDAHITLNAAAAKPNAKVRAGDHVRIIVPPPAPAGTQAEDIALDVLFEDADLIVLNKPPGLVVHPAAGHAGGTVVNALLHHCDELSGIGGVERPGIVHRLDKDTSGCLVAAKNDAAHQSLVRQFAGREVRKIYLALAAGRPAKLSGEIIAPIGRHPVHRQKMAVLAAGKGREAHTSWRVLSSLAAGTLIECTLHTGRTHQIRVHLRHIGHPILGDALYGKSSGFPRQMLHAWKLGFAHPRDGSALDFIAPLPADFREAGVVV